MDYEKEQNLQIETENYLNKWNTKICCPNCGESIQFFNKDNICSNCDLGFRLDNNTICWGIPDLQSKSVPQWKRYYEGLKYWLDPMASPYSPMAARTRYLVDDYYRRTLQDKHLAQEWEQHYLNGLNLSHGANVLDHGCGRGRNIGLLSQLGYNVAGQEIASDQWWDNLPRAFLQVVSPVYGILPWRDQSFNLVLNVMVIGHFSSEQLTEHCAEVGRILEPGGYWIILEANSDGYGAWMPRKHYRRLHTLQKMQEIASEYGFNEIDHSYEGFYAPVLPRFFNFVRKQCFVNSFNMYDYNSKIEKMIPQNRRGLWLLRLQKD